MKKYFLLAFLLLLIGAVWLFKGRVFPVGVEASRVGTVIAVTSPALGQLASTIGGDSVVVKVVGAKDTSVIYNADIFMFNGDGTDVWAEGLAADLAQKQIVPMKLHAGEAGGASASASHVLATRLGHVLGLLDPSRAQAYAQNAQGIK
jgi:ABC-type Zn uptake system ZnuABC Zn-binding protein ZnuA